MLDDSDEHKEKDKKTETRKGRSKSRVKRSATDMNSTKKVKKEENLKSLSTQSKSPNNNNNNIHNIHNIHNKTRFGEDYIVYLNIGGYKYVTKKSTLCDSDKPNYFTLLLEGVFPVSRDNKGYILIDRPGKYFDPILEYLITGEVIIPRNLSTQALVKEASFYCIDFPLDETHESLSFITDSWLLERFENRAYLKIANLSDPILVIVLKQFKEHANKSVKIETTPFLLNDQTPVNHWLDRTEYGRDYKRFEFIDEQKKLYSQEGCIVNDDYFALLDDPENRMTIINFCQHNDLTVDIVPVTINFPGVTGSSGSFTFGYKFVHLTNHVELSKNMYHPRALGLIYED